MTASDDDERSQSGTLHPHSASQLTFSVRLRKLSIHALRSASRSSCVSCAAAARECCSSATWSVYKIKKYGGKQYRGCDFGALEFWSLRSYTSEALEKTWLRINLKAGGKIESGRFRRCYLSSTHRTVFRRSPGHADPTAPVDARPRMAPQISCSQL